MQMTQADIVAWNAIAELTPDVAPDEIEFLDELVETVHDAPPLIGAKPGAFNSAEVGAVTVTVYFVIIEALKFGAPKLFDAALEVGKEFLKKHLAARKTCGNIVLPQEIDAASIDLLQVRRLILEAGGRNRLSPATCARIADAVIVQLMQTRRQSGLES